MRRHSIDPVSAVLGIAVIVIGVLVAVGKGDRLLDNGVWLIALVAIPSGIGLIPWARFAGPRPTALSTELSTEPATVLSPDLSPDLSPWAEPTIDDGDL